MIARLGFALSLTSGCDDGGCSGDRQGKGAASDLFSNEPIEIEVGASGALQGRLVDQFYVASKGQGVEDLPGVHLLISAFTIETSPGMFVGMELDLEQAMIGQPAQYTARVSAYGALEREAFVREDCTVEITRSTVLQIESSRGVPYRVEGHGHCPGPLTRWDARTQTFGGDGEVTLTPFSFSVIVHLRGWAKPELRAKVNAG